MLVTTEPVPTALANIRSARDPSSYIDPHGYVFRDGGHVYRAIYPEHASFYRKLIEDGRAKAWRDAHGLVDAAIDDEQRFGLANHLVLRHETVWPLTYCPEWTPAQLRSAALTTLDLAITLSESNLMLQDATPWNVLFKGTRPVFVDFTSIVPADGRIIWPAADQFSAFFERPLALGRSGNGFMARALLLDTVGGISRHDFLTLAGPMHRLIHPADTAADWLERRVGRSPELMRRVARMASSAEVSVTPAMRKRFLNGIRSKVVNGGKRTHEDPWTTYYRDIPDDVDRSAKTSLIDRVLKEKRPASVLDLGANTGVYALIAAGHGATVVALDQSEACMDRLFHAAERDGLALTPLVCNVLVPTPAMGFLGRQFPTLFSRVKSELCLCLGLMHHLYVTGRQTLERIADLMAEACTRHLVFEYIDVSDANMPLIGGSRAGTYDLAGVLGALDRHFSDLHVLPSDRPTRRMILGTRKA
jgi:SAM-dependent methyltransferase